MALTPATITNLDTNQKIECMFNPKEYTIAKSNTWTSNQVVGKNAPKLDFSGGGPRTLTMELFFDAHEEQGDVRPMLNKLWKFMMIEPSKKNAKSKQSRPPLCLFQWGGHWHFKAAMTNLSVQYTLFKPNGTPVRAMASVTLQEAEDPGTQPLTNPTSHSAPGFKRRIVGPRDSLALIAFEELGDSGKWRLIADANGLDNPNKLTPGQILAIPPVP
jgi:hypothetical protein